MLSLVVCVVLKIVQWTSIFVKKDMKTNQSKKKKNLFQMRKLFRKSQLNRNNCK